MDDEKIDPSKKDTTISSAADLTKTTKKTDAELTEDELAKVSGGMSKAWGLTVGTGTGF